MDHTVERAHGNVYSADHRRVYRNKLMFEAQESIQGHETW